MAIVRMKRLRLFGLNRDRDALLAKLQELGCVEVSQPGEVGIDDGLSPVTETLLAQRKGELAQLQAALATLGRYEKPKGKLLAPRPTLSQKALFDEQARADALAVAEEVNEGEKRLAALEGERGKLTAQKETLRPWLELDVPLDAAATADVTVTFGALSTRSKLEELPSQLSAATELCEVVYAGRDNENQYVLVLCHKKAEEEAMEVLKRFGFSRVNLRDHHGTARENDGLLDQRLAQLAVEKAQVETEIAAHTGAYADLEKCVDRLTQDIQREESKGNLLQTEATLLLEGWIPAEQEGKLEELAKEFTCAYQCTEPTEEEIPDVPVKLKNNILTAPLNMVTNMYVLPAYDGVDPNPLMAPFFIAFFGMMMADMGYGIIMVLLGALVLLKTRPREGMRNFAGLMVLCGISTFIWGAMTGGFFGDFIPQIIKMGDPTSDFVWFWPPLFTPLTDTLNILLGSLVLGLLQIITGMTVSVVRKCQAGEWQDALWDEITWWVILAGIGLAALNIGSVNGVPVPLVAGLLMLVYGSTRKAKGFGKVSALIGAVYNGATGFFSDILSYARLMALMLAGSVIAQVFNTLGSVFGNVVVFVIISLIGNTLNLLLNLLGCYVHDLRLQCLEYFGRFYKEGGKPFRPLAVNTKYYDIVE